MKSELPKIKIEERKCSEIDELLKEFIPHYTPEWACSDENDPGIALLKSFSYMTESVVQRLNLAPQKNFIAFLDMLGIKRLPAQPARVPLTFMPAKGLEKDILIPERTQVDANIKINGQEELPFETEKNLLAITSQLKKIVAFDPAKDAIYIPPQDFLDLERKRNILGSYKAVTSTLTFTKHIQLNYADGLKKGDFLKIGGDDACEYKEINKIDTTVIEVTDEFKSDFPVDTPVEKVTKFSLIEGKDLQDHCVYIAHKDFFNVKSTLTFTVYITHHRDTEVGITPLDVSWEYWGEVKSEDGGGKGEDWHKFVIVSDSTDELTRSGVTTLSKTTQGEIKEREINGKKNRWIRCKLNKNFTNDKTWKLPELDNIQFQVSSGGSTLVPDLAFYNDTQLDITQPFKPFGEEPKLLDTFAISSKEVFSKKGAEIKIKVEVEERRIPGAPSGILYYKKIKVFFPGIFGKLLEVEIDPGGAKEIWTELENPPDTNLQVSSMPSAASYAITCEESVSSDPAKFISVFVIAENVHLYEIIYDGIRWGKWIDRSLDSEAPNFEIDKQFDPASIICNNAVSAFVVGLDGQLYEFKRSLNEPKGKWFDHSKPGNVPLDSSPCVDGYISYDSKSYLFENRIKVFVRGKDYKIYELDMKFESKNEWQSIPDSRDSIPSEKLIAGDSKPFARVSTSGYFSKIFVRGSDGKLWQRTVTYEKEKPKPGKWEDLKQPEELKVASNPHGYIYYLGSSYEKTHIFVRGNDNFLWAFLKNKEIHQKDKNKKQIDWKNNSYKKSLLALSPFCIPMTDETVSNNELHIFSASNTKSLLEAIIPLAGTSVLSWKEYMITSENDINPILSWEFWNKKGWIFLRLKDGTSNLLNSGTIVFDLPEEIEETEIAGQKNYWIRARIVNGDYGRMTFTVAEQMLVIEDTKIIEQKMTSSRERIRQPIIKSLKIGYTLGGKQYPEKCLTHNNLVYLDQTEVSKIPDKFFKPFVQMDEKSLTIYLGFQNYFKGGPVRIFFAARELQINEETKPKLEWTYSIDNGWNEMKGYSDGAEGLIKPDILELIAPLDFKPRSLFGEGLFWIKGSLIKGNYEKDSYPLLDGIYPNTTWALQAATIKDVIIGSSDGYPDQVFSILKTPVLEKQNIRIQEFLSEEEKQDMIKEIGKAAIEEKKDEKGKVIETWILWKEVPDFFDSDPKSRHYTLDRATGQVQFGNGTNGMIPPKGDDNIKAFYQTGGGAKGNVGIGEIKSLKTSVPGIEKVQNLVAADGGANAATIEQMLEIGPAKISHRTRAVTVEDFEWLARKASRKVVKARCLPNTGKTSMNETGRVAVIIVPDENTAKPAPSLELKRKVRTYLEEHCANTISSQIFVDGPSYVEISISVDVHVISIDVASQVEIEVKKKLDDFFHPLTGGTDGKGWDFGRNVSDSDIYALLENIDGIDHIENLEIIPVPAPEEEVPWKSGIFLVANGRHTINTMLKKESGFYGSA